MPISLAAAVAAVVGVLAVGGGAVATVAAINEANSSDQAIVDHVIDGDTVDVRMYGAVQRVRLLNINAPEDNRGTGESECMGPEATARLAALLPEDSTVTLRYDSERYDRYGRLLASIYLDDVSINARMAREGLAVAMVVGDNTRFLREVQSAEGDAKEALAGVFGTALPCTLGSTVASYRAQVQAAEAATVPADSAGIAEVVTATTAVLTGADAATLALDSVEWVSPALRLSFKTDIRDLRHRVAQAKASQESVYGTAVAAEKAEADRIAAEEAARAAAEKAAAEQAAARAAAEQAARNATQRESGSSKPSAGSGGGSSSGDGGGSTYTGCRNYNGYGMIDTKGRHFEPIPCP